MTHILQGLDVIVFSVAKRSYHNYSVQHTRDPLEVVTKQNFLSVFGRAYLDSFTPKNILKAFEVTGVWPFNPNVISQRLLAPSLERSAHAHIPLELLTPLKDFMVIARGLFEDVRTAYEKKSGGSASHADVEGEEIDIPDWEDVTDSDSDMDESIQTAKTRMIVSNHVVTMNPPRRSDPS